MPLERGGDGDVRGVVSMVNDTVSVLHDCRPDRRLDGEYMVPSGIQVAASGR